MLAKTIKYTDYNGVERKETHYFNYNKAEIAEMELSTAGGLSEMIKKITEAQDGPSIMKLFKDIILGSYGVKSPDGKQFIKSDELSKQFSEWLRTSIRTSYRYIRSKCCTCTGNAGLWCICIYKCR